MFDAASGLVVLEDGSLDETCRYIASYYVDTKRDGLAEDVRGSANSTIDDDLIHVFHRSCGAYGHFILDGLCAVALLKDLILERRLKILVPTIFPAWITEVLAGVGFGPGHIVKASGVVRCRSLTTSTMLMAVNCFLPNPETIAKLRMLVDSPVVPPNRRIYLTRDGAYSPRFVRNEAETQLLFKNAGFEIVNPTSMTFPKQVELFASAKVIAGNHGSALVNMIFARSGAQIIDLMPEDWVGYWGEGGAPERWLLNLTGACGHDYSLVLSRSEMVGNPPLPNGSTILPRIDATTDLNSVQAAISELS
ncbi:glycosyltransferase family 61 protein [Mesorhizobium sp. ES1-4]|uniref:glycosyltransferase family 61 protein n=1 Tax=Mesorhizobium sp. ES1-4 TaxID=2876627 RepID=UPI001CCD754D|nr:glycosyltransferase family 61 protein [Mesorhizobium sp. ES1-4]MBZ9795690.1 glycosyltransferase family 61 protein [Mesorhizobium sp. ES1-4]